MTYLILEDRERKEVNLTIHKALFEEDVTIKIRGLGLSDKEVHKSEGRSIAQALWNSLPANTIDEISREFRRLEKALKEERG